MRTRPQAALMRFQGKSFWVVENTETIQSPHLHGLQTTVLLSPFVSPELASLPHAHPQQIPGIQFPVSGCATREPSLSHLTSGQERSVRRENLASAFLGLPGVPACLHVSSLPRRLPIAKWVPDTALDSSGAFNVIRGPEELQSAV